MKILQNILTSPFASSRPGYPIVNVKGERKGRTMNPLIQLKQTSVVFLAAFGLACFALSSGVQAVMPPPDGGYSNYNTAENLSAAPGLIIDVWGLVAVGDFNGDSHPDWALVNAATRQTAIWYMNNNALIGAAYGPTLPHSP